MRVRSRCETAITRFSAVPAPQHSPWLTLFTTVRLAIAEPRRETGARSPEDPPRTRAVLRDTDGVFGREVGLTKTMKRKSPGAGEFGSRLARAAFQLFRISPHQHAPTAIDPEPGGQLIGHFQIQFFEAQIASIDETGHEDYAPRRDPHGAERRETVGEHGIFAPRVSAITRSPSRNEGIVL